MNRFTAPLEAGMGKISHPAVAHMLDPSDRRTRCGRWVDADWRPPSNDVPRDSGRPWPICKNCLKG